MVPKPPLTQAKVDAFFETIKAEWDKLIKESGLHETIFIATSREAAEYLFYFEEVRKTIMDKGFTFPHLVPGLTITSHGGECAKSDEVCNDCVCEHCD